MVLVLKAKEFNVLHVNTTAYPNVIVKNNNSNREYSDIHGAIMSEPFCTEIIREFVMDGESVLDPFMGLATTGVVCNKLHHDFTGIEIHKPYFDLAKKRMEQATSQIDLFDVL